MAFPNPRSQLPTPTPRKRALRSPKAVEGAALVAGLLALLSFAGPQCSLSGLADGHRTEPDVPTNDGGDNPGDASTVTVVATGLEAPNEITRDERYLYFTTARNGGAVERCPIGSSGACVPHIVASGMTGLQSLVTASGHLAWVVPSHGEVIFIAGEGATPMAIAGNQASPANVLLLGDRAYWSNRDEPYGGSVVASCAIPGCKPIRVVARLAAKPGGILVRENDVMWLEEEKRFVETFLSSGQPDAGGENDACPFYLSPDTVHRFTEGVYDPMLLYMTSAQGSVRRIRRPFATDALNQCVDVTSTDIARGQENPWAIAVDSRHVYFTVNLPVGRGSLRRVPLDGGDVEIMLSGLDEPRGVVLGASYVYVTVSGAGQVLRVPK